jgi:iron complex transport system permease protein
MRTTALFLVLSLLALAAMAYALSVGSLATAPGQVWSALTGGGAEPARSIILDLRLPRAAAAFVTGAMLALAGALMQVLLRNPLADPYVLGVSGGASAAALGAMLLGLGGTWIAGAAFGGALLSIALVFGLAHGRGGWTPSRLLLTGVVIAAGWGALISLLLALSPGAQVQGMLFWLMGDLSNAGSPDLQALALLVALALSLAVARNLNLLSRGELQAGALGVAVGPTRSLVYLLASLLTAGAITLAGSVGFVGLVVPHLMRLLSGADHRRLLPASALAGGALLVVADTLARSLFAPLQLPVGVLTALLGVPLFLLLLYRNRAVAGV